MSSNPLALARRAGRGALRQLKRWLPSPDASPFEGERLPELRGKPISFGPVRLLSAEPPIFLTGMPYDEFLGIAPSFARAYGNAKAGFIVYPTWSVETVEKAKYIAFSVRRHTQLYGNHHFRYICNTQGEADLLNSFGLPALFLNHKFTVSEALFRPLEGVEPEFDALYNARFVAGKRHELAAEIERVAYVTYAEPQETRRVEFRKVWGETAARNPGHVLLNPIEDGLPVSLAHEQVNAALNRAHVGLILSGIEGASYATVEYMLAGLPVVSTASIGGRDVFFDDAYCRVVEPNPRAVREAVEALKVQRLPRDFVRAQTLKRLEPDRRRFLDLVDGFLEELGERRRFHGVAWPFASRSGVPWDGFKHHLAELEREQKRQIERDLQLPPESLGEEQLTANEMRPVLQALRERPGACLLVFGCGHDSPLWEKANAGGTTVFLEDDASWAQTLSEKLTTATIHTVAYRAALGNWRRLLDRPEELAMDLPESVRARKWDIILIDGPAGWRDDLPGRMESIFEASRLVAPGGRIFLHDAERPAESAFAARYFAGARVSVEARGRAVLRGYDF